MEGGRDIIAGAITENHKHVSCMVYDGRCSHMEGGSDGNAGAITENHKHVSWSMIVHAYIWRVAGIAMQVR